MQLYLVNDTIHGRLREDNPTLSFTLGRSAAQTVNIKLPYQAFDLQVTQPIAENRTHYFPLPGTFLRLTQSSTSEPMQRYDSFGFLWASVD